MVSEASPIQTSFKLRFRYNTLGKICSSTVMVSELLAIKVDCNILYIHLILYHY